MKENILNNLELLPFFSKAALLAIESVSLNSLNQNIKRWNRNGFIIRLKGGLYVTKTFLDRNMNEPGYIELVANKLVMPSYLSLEYVLQRNNLLTEATFTISSVTLKSTRQFSNRLATFSYRTIKKDFYFGFEKRNFGRNSIFIARPAKALFDYLYFRLSSLDEGEPSTVEELRINWGELGEADFSEFCEMTSRSGIKKMSALLEIMKEEYANAHR